MTIMEAHKELRKHFPLKDAYISINVGMDFHRSGGGRTTCRVYIAVGDSTDGNNQAWEASHLEECVSRAICWVNGKDDSPFMQEDQADDEHKPQVASLLNILHVKKKKKRRAKKCQ